MKYILIITVIFLTLSCTSNVQKKVDNPDSHENYIQIRESLDSVTAIKFKKAYINILQLNAIGGQGRAGIISQYEKRYEDVTFEDVLNNIDKPRK